MKTMKSKCVALIFVVLLLAIARTTQPAGAWVLWVREDFYWDPKGDQWGGQKRHWNVLDASSSETECRRKLGEATKRIINPNNAPKGEDVLYKVTGDTIEFVFLPKDAKPTDKIRRSQVLYYICLPDTVNPRETGERK